MSKIKCPFLKVNRLCVNKNLNYNNNYRSCAKCEYKNKPSKCPIYRKWYREIIKNLPE